MVRVLSVSIRIFHFFNLGENVLVANVGYPEISTLDVYLPGIGVNWYLFTGTSQRVYAGGEWHSIEVDLTFVSTFHIKASINVNSFIFVDSSLLQVWKCHCKKTTSQEKHC